MTRRTIWQIRERAIEAVKAKAECTAAQNEFINEVSPSFAKTALVTPLDRQARAAISTLSRAVLPQREQMTRNKLAATAKEIIGIAQAVQSYRENLEAALSPSAVYTASIHLEEI